MVSIQERVIVARVRYVKQEVKEFEEQKTDSQKMNDLFKKVSLNSILLLSKAVVKQNQYQIKTILDSSVFLIQHSNLDTFVDFFPCLVGDDCDPDLEKDH